jgi:hypothetical protein
MSQSSTDLWFSAFLMHKGHQISKFDKLGRGKVKCYFELTDEEWSAFKLEFNNSELVKFKALTEQIKDLAF